MEDKHFCVKPRTPAWPSEGFGSPQKPKPWQASRFWSRYDHVAGVNAKDSAWRKGQLDK